MGIRGPVSNLARRQLHGNNRKPKLVLDLKPGKAPKAPVFVRSNPEALAFWKRYVPSLARLGLASELDREALALLASTWAAWCEAAAKLAVEGATYTTPTGLVKVNPLTRVVDQLAKTFIDVASRFGLTPAARARLNVAPEQLADAGRGRDWLDEFLEGNARDKARFFRGNVASRTRYPVDDTDGEADDDDVDDSCDSDVDTEADIG